MDYKILTASDSGNITFTSGNAPERVSGISALVQEVLIELLSDYDARTGRGCNLIKNINDLTLQTPQAFPAVVAQSIRTAQTHIIDNQSSSNTLLPDERLISIDLVNSRLTNGSYFISFKVTNVNNESITVQLPL